jgi:hypothetical protein
MVVNIAKDIKAYGRQNTFASLGNNLTEATLSVFDTRSL